MARATKVEVEHRILELVEAIANGFMKKRDLVRIASEGKWNIGERQLTSYIAEAREVFSEMRVKDIDKQRNARVQQLEHLMQKNYQKGDYQEARHCIKALADLEGLIKSRFRDTEDEKESPMRVVSRFEKKWKEMQAPKSPAKKVLCE